MACSSQSLRGPGVLRHSLDSIGENEEGKGSWPLVLSHQRGRLEKANARPVDLGGANFIARATPPPDRRAPPALPVPTRRRRRRGDEERHFRPPAALGRAARRPPVHDREARDEAAGGGR